QARTGGSIGIRTGGRGERIHAAGYDPRLPVERVEPVYRKHGVLRQHRIGTQWNYPGGARPRNRSLIDPLSVQPRLHQAGELGDRATPLARLSEAPAASSSVHSMPLSRNEAI